MLKSLIIALLVCAALVAGARPGMALMGDQAPQAGAEMAMHHQAQAPCESEEGAAAHHLPSSPKACAAMASGCFPPAIGNAGVRVARIAVAVRWTPWLFPVENLVPVAVAPDLRPPRAAL